MERDDVIERVRKLMERSVGRGCTQAEAETAAAMASRIMAEHNLTVAEVEAHESTVDAGWMTGDADVMPRLNLEAELAAGICARFFFIRWYYQRTWDDAQDRYVTVVRFFGKPENVETSRWVYKALRAAFESLWADYRVRTNVHHTERRLFATGVARGFMDKMRAERAAMEVERDLRGDAGSTGTALATIGDKLAAAYKEAHPRIRSAAPSAPARGSNGTFAAGRAAGSRLNLARPIGGDGGPKGLPGA